SASEFAFAEEPVHTISQIEEPSHPMFETGARDQPIVQTSHHPEWFPLPKKPPTPDRDWNKTLPAVQGSAQTWISELAKQADYRSSFNELLDTPLDFFNFIMNRLGVDTLTPKLLAEPTYELMRRSCNSLTELEYHLKEVYKATTDQLDWVNPKGQQYPHNLLQPLPLIPDNRGRRVIPFAHFINKDLEYLRGGTSSRKYTTSVTKIKAADYGHIKWIEDLQFYGFAVNRESALDVYSKRRIITVTDLKIVEWHNYKHLDWISAVRVAVQIQTDRLHDSYQRENDEFLKTIDDNVKRIIKEQVKSQVKDQVSRILPRIEQFVNAQLEYEVLTRSSHSSQTSYAVVADLSEMELKKILIEKMEGNKSIQRSDEQRNLYKALVDAYEADNTILDSYRETAILKRRREDDDDQEGPSAGSDRGSKRRREDGEPESARALLEPVTRSAGRSTTGSKSRQASASEFAFAEEPVHTISQIEEPSHPMFETGARDQPIVQTSHHPEWFPLPKKPPTPDRDWNKTLPAVQGSAQTWISELVKQADSRFSFNELLDTPLDFFNFIMNRLGVDTLTPELLAEPTYELMRRSCNSLTELEYHLKEVYKATTDQLVWVNPKGQQYPHNLLQPLPLIPDNRGRRVIPFAHFINKDLEYLRGVTDLKIVEWHNYKHLDWISVRRDDDKIYKFKEGNFKRLRLEDIEDMLLLLVQGKLSNLTVKERFAFNVSLRMFTRSIVIQRRVKDLQLGVETYQKRLNLTKPDTYRSDLKRREAYTAYSNPRGFIHQNKDTKNKLMRIDELHKFSNGTLNDVRNDLDDRLNGIRMQYLP
nr:hypothetical protein [Tanacetum cinerariifolium]